MNVPALHTHTHPETKKKKRNETKTKPITGKKVCKMSLSRTVLSHQQEQKTANAAFFQNKKNVKDVTPHIFQMGGGKVQANPRVCGVANFAKGCPAIEQTTQLKATRLVMIAGVC